MIEALQPEPVIPAKAGTQAPQAPARQILDPGFRGGDGSRAYWSSAEPLAVYIHWPFCRSKCPYCDFNSHVREAIDGARWSRALLADLDRQAVLVPDREVASVFFGGGTPSLMPPEAAEALIQRVKTLW